MTRNLADYFHLSAPYATEDAIRRRGKSATALVRRWALVRTSPKAIEKAEHIASIVLMASGNGRIDSTVRAEIVEAIRSDDAGFIADGHDADVEIALCACFAALQLLTRSMISNSLFAEALLSALEFDRRPQASRIAALRGDLLAELSRQVERAAEGIRARQRVDESGLATDNGLVFAIRKLAANGRADSEELELLWWVLNGSSAIAGKPLRDLAPETAAPVAALELAALLIGPAASAHCALVTRSLERSGARIGLNQLGRRGRKVQAAIRSLLAGAEATIASSPRALPAMTALRADDVKLALQELTDAGVHATRIATPAEWATRLLREASVLRATGHAIDMSRLAHV